MDGWQGRLKQSLQLRLSLALALAILLVALAASVFSFVAAFNDAQDLQDSMLQQVATLFDRYQPPLPQRVDIEHLPEHDEDMKVIVQWLDAPPAGAPAPSIDLPPLVADGLQTVDVRGESYRVLAMTLRSGARIAVAQETEVRDGIATDSVLHTLMPFMILIPLLLALLTRMIAVMLRPVTEMAADIDRRGDGELHALHAAALPLEVRPFVVAINRLLDRVAEAMEGQRRFVADAAHELRSPLTALSLQAERLAAVELPAPAEERLHSLREGIDRARMLLDQLLNLARVQADATRPPQWLSVLPLYRRALEELMPLALAKQIDIGVSSHIDAQVRADEFELLMAIKNLVDNAIRYAPVGGRVDLSIRREAEAVLLEIEDNGPGIPAAERERVLAPFHRLATGAVPGSGLGLSIVKTICDRVGATLTLGDAERAASGLKVSLRFDAPPG